MAPQSMPDPTEQQQQEDEEEGSSIEGIRFVDYKDESQLEDVMALVGKDLSEPYSIFTYRYFLHQFPDLCILAVPTSEESNDKDGDPKPIGCVVCKIDEEGVVAENSEVEPLAASFSKISNSTAPTEGEKKQGTNPQSLDGDLVAQDSASRAEGDDDVASSSAPPPPPPPSRTVRSSGYMAMLAVDETYRRSGIGTELVRRAVRRMRKRGCSSVTLETEVSNKAAMRLYEDRLGFIREELLVRYYLNWGDAYRLRLWFD